LCLLELPHEPPGRSQGEYRNAKHGDCLMSADLNLFGVFLNGGLVTSLIALALHIPLRMTLRLTGSYRFFWHPALVNVCTFVILWGAVAYVLQASPTLASVLLG
jgi:hypothetical protein